VNDLVQAVKSFPAGSAGGPSGFSADHFKQLLFVRGQDFDKSLAFSSVKFINTLLAGQGLRTMAPFFASANLIALKKPDDGVRPIAIGEFFCRLSSKCVMAQATPSLPNIFGDIQLGVKTPNACESIIHDLNSLTASGSLDTSVLLKIDWKNAFNECSRKVMFEEVQSKAPGLANFVEWIYGCQANLFYFDKLLFSSSGAQQGDPLGPFLFCLIQQRMLKNMDPSFEISYKKFYMDDGNMRLPIEKVPIVLEYFRIEGLKVGLTLNIGKCEIWAPNLSRKLSARALIDPDFVLPDLVIHEDEGVNVLGGPVAKSPDFLKKLIF
jgi:Reverse transcriptase (RNA-dependent DNA polymerase)